MALSADIIKLLNDFADSQPALRLPGKPLAESNPQLGTALDDAISAADAEAATGVSYTPSTGANWVNPDPTTVQAALDRLAAVVATLNAGPIP